MGLALALRPTDDVVHDNGYGFAIDDCSSCRLVYQDSFLVDWYLETATWYHIMQYFIVHLVDSLTGSTNYKLL